MLIVVNSEMSMLVLTNPHELLVRLLLAVCLVACLVWLVLCLLMMPVMLCLRGGQHKNRGLKNFHSRAENRNVLTCAIFWALHSRRLGGESFVAKSHRRDAEDAKVTQRRILNLGHR
jgi:hypothetical protein